MRPATKKWVYLAIAFGVISLSTFLSPSIHAQRNEYQLVLPPAPDDTAMSMLYTPLLAVGRAPLVDVLWIRATKLKEEGRVFDALQLAKTICKLQPKFPQVWAFQAWNMSYNISVTCKSPEERWRWVRNGYELIRDKGIPLNPNNTQLYRELAWILFHKVGDFMDDWHFYYKNEFAKIAESALGHPPEGFAVPGRVRGDYYRNYDYASLALMPKTYDELMQDQSADILLDQYRLTALQPAEALALRDLTFDDVRGWVEKLDRPGLLVSEVGSLRDLLTVDLPVVKAFADELRQVASSNANDGSFVGLIRGNKGVANLVSKIESYGFDPSEPSVFHGLINATRTNRLEMPNVPKELQDRRKNEFLGFLRSKEVAEARRKLKEYWDDRLALDIEQIKKNAQPSFEAMREFANKLSEFGFDIKQPDVFLGIADAVHDNVVEIPGITEEEQVNRVPELLKLWNDSKYDDARKAFNAFWRSHRVREEFKVEPMRVIRLQNGLGVTLDFRIAETHALYWANLGTEVGTDARLPVDIHRLNTDRIEFYCLQKMYHRGRLAMSPEATMGEPPLLTPDLRVIPALVRAFIEGSKEYLKSERNLANSQISANFETAFVGFMRDAILASHEYEDDKMGRWLFDILKKERPDPMYANGYEEFLKREVLDDRSLGDYRVTLRRIRALIGQAIRHFAFNEDDRAALFVARAKQVYVGYHNNIVSRRLELAFTFEEVVRDMVHSSARIMNRRETYLRVCEKLGVEPLPEAKPQSQGTVPVQGPSPPSP